MSEVNANLEGAKMGFQQLLFYLVLTASLRYRSSDEMLYSVDDMDSDTTQLTGHFSILHMPEWGVGTCSRPVTRRRFCGPVSDGVPEKIWCRVAIP